MRSKLSPIERYKRKTENMRKWGQKNRPKRK